MRVDVEMREGSRLLIIPLFRSNPRQFKKRKDGNYFLAKIFLSNRLNLRVW